MHSNFLQTSQQLIALSKLPKLGALGQNWSGLSAGNAQVAYAYALAAVDLMMDRYAAYGIQNVLRAPEKISQIEAEIDKLFAE